MASCGDDDGGAIVSSDSWITLVVLLVTGVVLVRDRFPAVTVLGGAVAGGVFIAVVLMLFYAIRDLVDVGQDPHSSSLVIVDDE